MNQPVTKKSLSSKESTESSELKRKKKKIKESHSQKTIFECVSPRGDGHVKTIIKVTNQQTQIKGNTREEKKKSKKEESRTKIIQHKLNHQITKKIETKDYKNTLTEEDPEKEIPKITRISEGRIEIVEEEDDDVRSDDEQNMIHDQEDSILQSDEKFHLLVNDEQINSDTKKSSQIFQSEYEEEGDYVKQSDFKERKCNRTVRIKINEQQSSNLGNSTKKKKKQRKDQNPQKK